MPDIQAADPIHQPKLGRIPAIDARSHLPRFAMAAPRTDRTFRNWLSPGWREWPAVLDQGATSQCVAYSATKYLLTHPIVNRPHVSCEALYRRAQQLDEWPGEAYDGTSVNAGCKALRELGLVSGWTWAFEAEPAIRHCLEIGPVMLGTDWTVGMFDPDRNGYIWPNGGIVGGHAYLMVGVNQIRRNPGGTLGAVRILNSWGAGWGQKGRAWMAIDALERLLQGLGPWPGEAAVPIEVQRPR